MPSVFAELTSAAILQTVAVAAGCSIVIALGYDWLFVRPNLRVRAGRGADGLAATEPADAAEIRSRLAALEAVSAQALRHVGFVRFNAFEDVGSQLSFALAVVDAGGEGFLLTSIYSREEVRTYAKAVRNFGTDKEVSNEERRALQLARQQSKAM